MKTGILTFHRADNCGAVLQCYALQEALRKLGHEVSVIDYRQPYIEWFYTWRFRLRPVSTFLSRIWHMLERKKSFSRFRSFCLCVSERCPTLDFPDCDAYVIGSDQVWSEECTKEFDEVYYGEFRRRQDARVIGYSVSCPVKSVERRGREKLEESLRNFHRLSFREKDVRDRVREITGFQGDVTLDPTLLHDMEFWERLSSGLRKTGRRESGSKNNKKGGVVVYLYKYRLTKKEIEEVMAGSREIARRLDTVVIDLSDKIRDPLRFLDEIRSAAYVVTNSFHAEVFSLIFRKDFSVIMSGDALDTRCEELARNLDCGKVLAKASELSFCGPLDYDSIERRLGDLREYSIGYLTEGLSRWE